MSTVAPVGVPSQRRKALVHRIIEPRTDAVGALPNESSIERPVTDRRVDYGGELRVTEPPSSGCHPCTMRRKGFWVFRESFQASPEHRAALGHGGGA
jgi:hypothetical protein